MTLAALMSEHMRGAVRGDRSVLGFEERKRLHILKVCA